MRVGWSVRPPGGGIGSGRLPAESRMRPSGVVVPRHEVAALASAALAAPRPAAARPIEHAPTPGPHRVPAAAAAVPTTVDTMKVQLLTLGCVTVLSRGAVAVDLDEVDVVGSQQPSLTSAWALQSRPWRADARGQPSRRRSAGGVRTEPQPAAAPSTSSSRQSLEDRATIAAALEDVRGHRHAT